MKKCCGIFFVYLFILNHGIYSMNSCFNSKMQKQDKAVFGNSELKQSVADFRILFCDIVSLNIYKINKIIKNDSTLQNFLNDVNKNFIDKNGIDSKNILLKLQSKFKLLDEVSDGDVSRKLFKKYDIFIDWIDKLSEFRKIFDQDVIKRINLYKQERICNPIFSVNIITFFRNFIKKYIWNEEFLNILLESAFFICLPLFFDVFINSINTLKICYKKEAFLKIMQYLINNTFSLYTNGIFKSVLQITYKHLSKDEFVHCLIHFKDKTLLHEFAIFVDDNIAVNQAKYFLDFLSKNLGEKFVKDYLDLKYKGIYTALMYAKKNNKKQLLEVLKLYGAKLTQNDIKILRNRLI